MLKKEEKYAILLNCPLPLAHDKICSSQSWVPEFIIWIWTR